MTAHESRDREDPLMLAIGYSLLVTCGYSNHTVFVAQASREAASKAPVPLPLAD